MSKELNLTGMLNFNEMDMTLPNKVVEEILQQIPKSTNDIIHANIEEYNGHVISYTKKDSVAEVLGAMSLEKCVDIQDSLGKCGGGEEHKYECYLYTTTYEDYKYRMFFMRYGIAPYPVRFTLEESIARDIPDIGIGYIVSCNNREEVEDLIIKILTSKKALSVMQELIRVYQAKKYEESTKETEIDIGME